MPNEISNVSARNTPTCYDDAILKIAKQLKHATKDASIDKCEDSHHAPFKVDENFDCSRLLNPTKEQIVKLLKRKYLLKLKMLKPFVDVMKYKTSTKGVSICPIASTSKLWNFVYGSQRQVARVVQCAKEIGLLYCVDESYSNKLGYAKSYAYDKRVEKKLIELFNEHQISNQSKSLNQSYVISIIDTFARKGDSDIEQMERYKKYMENSKIRITQRTKLHLKEEFIVNGLNEMYPQYMEMLKTIDEDNATMGELIDYDYAKPNIVWDKNGNATKIGVRKTNAYCNLKVHGYENNQSLEGLPTSERGKIRDVVIESKLGGVFENDVKSSIYRITYLLNHGVWLDRDKDLYPMMAGFDFKSKDERNLFKSPLAMKLYFANSIDEVVSRSSYQDTRTKEFFKEINAREFLEKAQENMLNVIGNSYRSEIFLHESCIYTQVAHKIRELGYTLVQIYDGFFTNKPLDEKSFDEIVKDCALDYFKKWQGHWYAWK